MRKIGIVVVVGMVALAACVAPIQRKVEFDPAEYEPYAGDGDSTVRGQAFVKTRGGEVKYGAGNPVQLTPATTYSREWYVHGVLPGRRMTPADHRERQYVRTKRADAEGRFEFKSLPAGEYYVTCEIEWEVPAAFGDGTVTTGGTAHAEVKVEAGEEETVVVIP